MKYGQDGYSSLAGDTVELEVVKVVRACIFQIHGRNSKRKKLRIGLDESLQSLRKRLSRQNLKWKKWCELLFLQISKFCLGSIFFAPQL